MSKNITNNQRPTLNVIDSVSSVPFAVKGSSADGSVNVNITSGGAGGTQYTDGAAAIAHPIGTIPVFNNAGTITAVSAANPLPVTGSLTIGGTTDNTAFTAGTSTGTPTMGFYHSVIDTVTDGRAAAVGITSKRAMLVNLQTAAGVEIGVAAAPIQVSLANTASNATAVKVDGSAVTQPVSGTVTTTPPSNASTNIAQINGITPLMGNGGTGTGSLRVTIASDNTAFAVNSTLSAETTKVIGTVNIAASQTIAVTNTGTFGVQATLGAETTKVIGTVRTADGSGNLFTSNSTTFTAKNAQDINLLGSLGTAFSTAGKVDVKGADGDVFVRQATGTNLHTVIDSGTITAVTAITNALPSGTNVIGHVITDTGSVTTATLNAETTKVIGVVRTADGSGNLLTSTTNALDVNLKTSSITLNTASTQTGNWTTRIVGNAGATIDATVGAATAPTNMLAVGGVFNTSAPTLTNGQSAALQLDTSGNLKVTGSISVGGTTDEAAFTAASTTGTPSMGFYNDTTTSNLTAGQLGIPRLSVNRSQYTQIRDGAGNERGASVNNNNQLSVSVDNTPKVNVDAIGGEAVVTSAKGVQVTTVADAFGDPINSTNGSLNVYSRGSQDATELSQGGVAYFNSALSTTVQLIKTGRTNVYYLNLVNTNSTNAYVQVFDSSVSTITLGTTPPTEVWFVPANGCFEEAFHVPLTYWSGLLVAATTTATGSTALTTGLIVNLRTTP